METKHCPRCEQQLPITAFYPEARSDGLSYICRACIAERNRQKRLANPEKSRQENRERARRYREKNLVMAEMRRRQFEDLKRQEGAPTRDGQ